MYKSCRFSDIGILLILETLWDYYYLKHTTTLFSLYDLHILSQEWRVIADQVQIN